MKVYFLRRLLLVPLTMLGVTLLVFTITRVMPGSPIEKQMQAAAAAEGGSSGGGGKAGGLSDEALDELEREFGYDKAIPIAYLQWLGILPRERLHDESDFGEGGEEHVGKSVIRDPSKEVLVNLTGTGRQALVKWDGGDPKAVYLDDQETEISENGWKVRIETPEDRVKVEARRKQKEVSEIEREFEARAVVYKTRFSGLLQGDFGNSTEFGDPVLSLIKERIPIALYFGILTAIISYGVCLPLGIVKAIKHRTAMDNVSSILIFIGYAIPGFALGAVMVVYLGARMHLFPIMGLTSSDFESLSMVEKAKDLAHHTVLPLMCYLVGSFAWLTMMMKNNLMDNLAADYVRTAVAKGVGFHRAVFKHAFRNSFIPIASTLGQLITLFVSGSLLIETVFDIQGFGLLQYRAILGPDQMVIMGTLTISAFLMILGNILSDVIVAMIDPRVKFN